MKAATTYPKIIIHRLGHTPAPRRRLTASTCCAILLICAILAAGAARIQRDQTDHLAWQTCQAD